MITESSPLNFVYVCIFSFLLLSNKHANHNKPYKKNNMFMNKYKERERENNKEGLSAEECVQVKQVEQIRACL